VEEINLSLRGKATERLDLIYALKKNRLDNQTLETTYAIDYHKQCWGAEFSYSDSPDDRRFMVIFSLYGLGKVGNVTGRLP